MENNEFYDKLIEQYIILNIPKKYDDLGKIGSKISWYLADNDNAFITINKTNNKNIIEIDIKSAYTSLCDIIFYNTPFIEQIHTITDKFERNKFISNSLKTTNKLKEFASMSKIIIFGILMENYSSDIELLEIKKDGCVFLCNDNTVNKFIDIYNNTNIFTKFIIDNNIKFNINKYKKYYRLNTTSIFITETDEIIKKGIFKYSSEYINTELKNILIHNIINEDKILKIYSNKLLTIIKENKLYEVLKKYYICENNKILTKKYNYENVTKDSIYPYSYLTLFIYPAIISNKI